MFLFLICHSFRGVEFPLFDATIKIAFIGLVTRGHRSVGLGRCEAGPAAPKPTAAGSGATYLWRHAVGRMFRRSRRQHSAVSSSHPRIPLSGTPVPAFRPYSGPLVRGTPVVVSLGCGHRRAKERLGLYQTQPLNLALDAPHRSLRPIRLSARFEDLGLVFAPSASHKRC